MAVSQSLRSRARKNRDAERTKQNFIHAAEALFAERGFDGATLDMLAARAGANKALVSYYFGSKEGLYDAVIAAVTADIVEQVLGDINEKDEPVARFRRYIMALAAAFASRPSFPAILMREYISGDVQLREEPFRQVLQFYRITESIYQAGRRAKIFRKLDPHQLHLSVVAPLVHFVLTIRLRQSAFSRYDVGLSDPAVEEFARHHAALLIDGLKS